MALAAALETSAGAAEGRRGARSRLLQRSGPAELPDGTATERFRFRHELYQEVAYRLLPAATRADLHERIGAALETAYGERAADAAAELSYHFVRSHSRERAVRYLELAARLALGRRAYEDAARHLRTALSALELLAAGPERARYELELSCS